MGLDLTAISRSLSGVNLPDTLINEDIVTEYELYDSPVRSAMFNPGKTSRINVGNFMARLIVENDLWNKWKGRMPVMYNKMD